MTGSPRLAILARRRLAADPPPGPALLLEGDWPAAEQSADRWSLDSLLDARHAWIDREAARLATDAARGADYRSLNSATLADLLTLKLRYYGVRLLRLVAFLERWSSRFPAVELYAESPRDDDYAALVRQVFAGRCRESLRDDAAPAPASDATAPPWRRWAGTLASLVQPRRARQTALLCGNPRHLHDVANALSSAGMQPWWLYDAPAVRAWLARRPRGEGQLWCRDSASVSRMPIDAARLCRELPELDAGAFDLRPIYARWLAREAAARSAWLSRVPAGVDRHIARLRPKCVVLDQDATPLARAVVASARRREIPSLVVQHGAPCVRFGFAPLAADRFCAWGQPTRRRLVEWGVDAERIVVTGCPRVDRPASPVAALRQVAARRPRLLLLATVPPRDERPDSLEFHFTTRGYEEMLAALAECCERFGAELISRPHPRGGAGSGLAALASRGARIESHATLEAHVRWADCVVSCASSAGIEAAHLGARVINLLPPGSGGLFEDPAWGLAGTARTAPELEALLARCLAAAPTGRRDVSTAFDVDDQRTAALRVVDVVHELIGSRHAEIQTRPGRAPRIQAAPGPALLGRATQ